MNCRSGVSRHQSVCVGGQHLSAGNTGGLAGDREVIVGGSKGSHSTYSNASGRVLADWLDDPGLATQTLCYPVWKARTPAVVAG